jgi:16S rRNA (guanine966-N2)-methyltransferase
VLDLFAGSGAVGLEASSRGAAAVVLVERDTKALKALRANAETVLKGTTPDERRAHVIQVAAVSVESFVGSPGDRFDVVFADPPYALPDDQLAGLLEQLAGAGGLAPDALVVVERATRDAGWVWPQPIAALRERAYGEATLWYGRAAAVAEGTSGPDPQGQADEGQR